jgi:hypothetical protein
MNDQSNAPVSAQPASAGNEKIMAIVSLVLGVLSLCGVVVPIIGIPFGIIGIVLGILGRKDVAWRTYAAVGIALSAVGILLSCVPVGVIAVMRLLGPKIGNTFSSINSSLP